MATSFYKICELSLQVNDFEEKLLTTEFVMPYFKISDIDLSNQKQKRQQNIFSAMNAIYLLKYNFSLRVFCNTNDVGYIQF